MMWISLELCNHSVLLKDGGWFGTDWSHFAGVYWLSLNRLPWLSPGRLGCCTLGESTHGNKNRQPPSQGQVMMLPTCMVIWPLVLVLHWPGGHYTTTDTLPKFTQQNLMVAGKACLYWTLQFSWHLDMMPRTPWPWTLLLPHKEAPLSRVVWIHTYLMSLLKCRLY